MEIYKKLQKLSLHKARKLCSQEENVIIIPAERQCVAGERMGRGAGDGTKGEEPYCSSLREMP